METWFDILMENAIEALWVDPTRDPAEVMDEREHELIEATGYNMAGVLVK